MLKTNTMRFGSHGSDHLAHTEKVVPGQPQIYQNETYKYPEGYKPYEINYSGEFVWIFLFSLFTYSRLISGVRL